MVRRQLLRRFNAYDNAFAVSFEVSKRRITVKGPRGVLKRDFRHMAIEMDKVSKNELRVRKW